MVPFMQEIRINTTRWTSRQDGGKRKINDEDTKETEAIEEVMEGDIGM